MKKNAITKVLAAVLALMLVFTGVLSVPASAEAAAKPSKITLSATKKTMSVGEKYTLKVKSVTPKGASKSVTFKTSNKKVAAVNSKGQITAKKKGTATITVTSKSNSKAKATCKVTVKDVIKKITVTNSVSNTVAVHIGKTVTLKTKLEPSGVGNKKLTYSSNKKSVATVDKKGKVKGKKAGTAKITIKAAEGKAKATITVKVPAKNKVVKSVTVSPTSKTMNVGDKFKLSPAVSPKNAEVKLVSYKSSDEKVAVVDSKGNVTAKGAGTASITVTTLDGNKKANCAVTVNAPATPTPTPTPTATPAPTSTPVPTPTATPTPNPEIAITGVTMPASMEIYANTADASVTAAVVPATTTMSKQVAYTSSNPNYLTVGADGKLQVQARNLPAAEDSVKVTVTAKAINGKTAATEVTIILRENADVSDEGFYAYDLKGDAEVYEVSQNGSSEVADVEKTAIADTLKAFADYKWSNDTLKDNWDDESFVNLMKKVAYPNAEEIVHGTVTGNVMTVTKEGSEESVKFTLENEEGSSLTIEYNDKTVHLADINITEEEAIYQMTANVQVGEGKDNRNLLVELAKDGSYVKAYRVPEEEKISIASVEGTAEGGYSIKVNRTYVGELGLSESIGKTIVKNSYIPVP